MKRAQIAAQLYSFRDFIRTPTDFRQTLSRLKSVGYDAVQLSTAVPQMPTADLRQMLSDEGFVAPTAHERSTAIVHETMAVADRLLELDCRHVAYPFPHTSLGSVDEVIELAKLLNSTAITMAQPGVALAYHNHAVEFLRFNGKAVLDIIYDEAPDLEAEIDTYWVQEGGGSPLRWVQDFAGRMQVIHLKDYVVQRCSDAPVESCGETAMATIGSGNLNWDEIIPAAEQGGVQWFVVEHDDYCKDPFASFEASINYLCASFVEQ